MSKACQDQYLTRVSSSLKHTLQRILHRTHRKSCRLPSKSPYPRSGWLGAHSIRRHPYPTRKGPFPFCLSLVSLPVPLWWEKQDGGRECKEGDEEVRRSQGNVRSLPTWGQRWGAEAPETALSSEDTHGRPLSFLLWTTCWKHGSKWLATNTNC